jgi:transposase-like protein
MKGHGTKFGRKKEEAIAALLTQRNIEEAARSIGVAPNTLLKWQKLPEFDSAYREARKTAYRQAVARLQQGTSAAATTLLKTLIDPATPASVKVRAAEAIFSRRWASQNAVPPCRLRAGGMCGILPSGAMRAAVARRIHRLEDRFGVAGETGLLMVASRVGLALDADACLQILRECGSVPTGGIPTGSILLVNLLKIPGGLNAAETEKYLRAHGADLCSP